MQIQRLVPTKVQSLMCGVLYIDLLKHNRAKLVYTDGTTETAHLSDAQITAGHANFFAFVSAVQSQRPHNTRLAAPSAAGTTSTTT